MNTLLAITTANQWKYTVKALESIQFNVASDVKTIVYDDCSEDETIAGTKSLGFKIVTKNKSHGLTHSWNLAYKDFKTSAAEFFIIANNDILIPKGAIEELCKVLQSNTIAGSLSSLKGVGHQPNQACSHWHQMDLDEHDPLAVQEIQNHIQQTTTSEGKIDFLNGFFFGFNRNIINYELPDGNLFDPKNRNVGNEDDINERIPGKKAVALKSFIFHFKGVSFENYFTEDGIEIERNATREQAKNINTNILSKTWYRIRRKLKQLTDR